MSLEMDCEQPTGFTLFSRGAITFEGERIRPLTVTGQGRCRKCRSCRKRKSLFWAARAVDEFQRWPVSVMGTFTLGPEQHLLLDNRARVSLRERGRDFDLISDQDRFSARCTEFGKEVAAWLKRVRQGRDGETPTRIRYLLIAEAHDSEVTSAELRGRPHFHMLLHDEVAGAAIQGNPATAIVNGRDGEWEMRKVFQKGIGWRPAAFVCDEAFIRKNWTLGFTKFRWAEDARSCYYVCKYITKGELTARVRSSIRYGRLGDKVSPRSAGQGVKDPRENLTPPRPETARGGGRGVRGKLQGGFPQEVARSEAERARDCDQREQ